VLPNTTSTLLRYLFSPSKLSSAAETDGDVSFNLNLSWSSWTSLMVHSKAWLYCVQNYFHLHTYNFAQEMLQSDKHWAYFIYIVLITHTKTIEDNRHTYDECTLQNPWSCSSLFHIYSFHHPKQKRQGRTGAFMSLHYMPGHTA
jgi:hypothetical protein